MTELLVAFQDVVLSPGGRAYAARALGAELGGSMWQGWIEFTPLDGGETVRSGRETTQPNRDDTVYWATGLTAVYLEGALARALNPPPAVSGTAPAPPPPASHDTSVLDPFASYLKGELLLRRQLGALSSWRLVSIITAHGLSDQEPTALAASPPEVLVELIVLQVKAIVDREAAGREQT